MRPTAPPACQQCRKPLIAGRRYLGECKRFVSQLVFSSLSLSPLLSLPLVTDEQSDPSPPSTLSQLVEQPGAATTSGLLTRAKGKRKATA